MTDYYEQPQNMFYWDSVDEKIVQPLEVGKGILDGKEIVAIRWGSVTEWVSPGLLHDSIDAYLQELRENARKRRSMKR